MEREQLWDFEVIWATQGHGLGQGASSLNAEAWRDSRCLSRMGPLRLADRSDVGTKGKSEIQGQVQVLD